MTTLGFGESGELLEIEQFVAHAGVEGLHEGVLPRRAAIRRAETAFIEPATMAFKRWFSRSSSSTA